MANIFPTAMKVSPSFTEPGLIVTYAQASGAFAALEGGAPKVRIGSEDMVVYVNSLDLRTEAAVGQSPFNLLPSATLVADYYSTPTYLIAARAIWDHHDIARAAMRGVALLNAQDMAVRQGIYQQMRVGVLFGFTPANGEGLMNTAGATQVTLPPDSYGNTASSTYDNGQMALFWLGQIAAVRIRAYQTGGKIKTNIVIISPQRIFEYFAQANIVQVTSYQRPGGGTDTTGGVIKAVSEANGVTFDWFFDDTLQGQGAGGADAIILTIPEIEVPDLPGLQLNTNEFGKLTPAIKTVNTMYMDMAAPMKIPTPTPDGAVTEKQELRTTSGWCLRPQCITIVSINP